MGAPRGLSQPYPLWLPREETLLCLEERYDTHKVSQLKEVGHGLHLCEDSKLGEAELVFCCHVVASGQGFGAPRPESQWGRSRCFPQLTLSYTSGSQLCPFSQQWDVLIMSGYVHSLCHI